MSRGAFRNSMSSEYTRVVIPGFDITCAKGGVAEPARPLFSKFYLEITSRCNLACPFCPPTKRAGEHLPLERLERLLARLTGRVGTLYLHVKGEPLLHPQFAQVLALTETYGFRISITTNGTLLASKKEQLLGVTNLVKLSVSLHSHVGTDRIEEYWKTVTDFLDAHRKQPRFPVSLRLWNRGNGGLPPETARLWELIAARYGIEGGLEAAATCRSIRLDERVYLNQAESFIWPDARRGVPGPSQGAPDATGGICRGFCLALRDQAAVLVDGTFVPCCLDGEGSIALGNLLVEDLDTLLASPRARALYEGFSRREVIEPLCQSCGFRLRFDRRAIDSASKP